MTKHAAARKTKRPQDTVARLTDAAIDVISKNGWDGAGIIEIARRAGLSNGAIYANFSNRNELLGAAVERHMNALVDFLGSYERSSRSEWDALIGLVRHIPKANAKGCTLPRGVLSDQLFAEAFAASSRNARLMTVVKRYMDVAAEQYTSFSGNALTEKGLDHVIDARALAWLICACLVGARLLHLIDHPAPDADQWEHLIDRLFGNLSRGASLDSKKRVRTAARKQSRP